jgi:hypothetical protein
MSKGGTRPIRTTTAQNLEAMICPVLYSLGLVERAAFTKLAAQPRELPDEMLAGLNESTATTVRQ